MASARAPLEILLELTRTLSDKRSLEEALQATTDAALELLPCDHASLRLFDDERRELLSSARSGAGRSEPPLPFRVGEGVIGAVAGTGNSALVEDIERDPRYSHRSTGFAVRSLVAVPLTAGGHVVGVLSASSPVPAAFGARDRDLAQLLANCTAPAIETARLARLAVTDDLTKTFNYRYLGSRLHEEVHRAQRYGTPFSLLLMDLDFFKRVNDRFGHAVGDEVLRAFVQRVRVEVRQADILIRRGGEEFVLLMPATNDEEARTVGERIRARVAERSFTSSAGQSVAITVSIGVATWEAGEDGALLEARADAALYVAKQAGRDRVTSAPPPDRPPG